jgi:hypothetical protein
LYRELIRDARAAGCSTRTSGTWRLDSTHAAYYRLANSPIPGPKYIHLQFLSARSIWRQNSAFNGSHELHQLYSVTSVEQSTETNYLSKCKSNPPIFYLSKSKSIRQKSYLSKSKKVLMKKLLFK